MTVSTKIDRLLEITGTPPERREIARKNYSRLIEKEGEKAIDSRLAEFEAMHKEVALWRESRSKPQYEARPKPAAREADSIIYFLIREKLLARRLEGQIDALASRLSKDGIDLDAIDKKMRDSGLLSGPKHASQLAAGLSSPYDFFRYFNGILDALSGKTQVDPLISYTKKLDELLKHIENPEGLAASLRSLSSRIDTDQAILGLGRMAAYVSGFSPDVIFTLNEGGAAVGKFIQKHLNLDIPVIALQGDSAGLALSGNLKMPGLINKPLVIDDVARSGGTVNTAFAWITERYPLAAPRATTIAASLEAIELVGQGTLLTPNPTEHRSIRLPYDPHAGFAIREQNNSRMYVFGADAVAPEDRLVVPIEIVDKVVAEQERTLFAGAS